MQVLLIQAFLSGKKSLPIIWAPYYDVNFSA